MASGASAGALVPPVGAAWDAVVLLQMGGPTTIGEIEPFLARLFADPDIIRLPGWMRPAQPSLARFVARRRAPKVRPRYEAMGNGSPLGRITQEQAEQLQKALGVPVRVAMRYTAPWADEVVARLREQGAKRVLLLPLYPHWSLSTTASSLRDFARALREARYAPDVWVVRDWGLDRAYLELVAQTCMEALEALRKETQGPVHLVFSAHGVPVRYVEEGDTYQEEVEASAAWLRRRLVGPFASVRHGYQSAVGPVQWIGPDTQAVLEDLAARDAKAVVVAPLGFVSDHIETLYDMDTLYRDLARKAGLMYARAPSFNARPAFARVLADLARAGRHEPFEVSAWTA